MANQKPLVIDSGTTQRLPDVDTLLVGAAIEPSTGTALRIGNAAGTTVTTFPGPVRLDGDVTTVGGTTFTTDATFEGNVTFGNGPADTVAFAASTTVVSNINFSSPATYKITNLANGTSPNDAVNLSQLTSATSGFVTGAGANDQVTVWSGTNTQDGSPNLTFNGATLGVGAGITQSGGAVSLAGNAASSFTTSVGALTLTSATTATWSAASGDLTVQATTGRLTLTGGLNANNAVTINTTGAASGILVQSVGALGMTLNATNGPMTVLTSGNIGVTSVSGGVSITSNTALQMTASAGSEVVVNDGSADVDFRVESDLLTHAIFVDAGNNRVGVSASNLTHTFNVGDGTNSNFCVASGGRIHTYDGSAPLNGQVLIGDTALGNFAKATLTAGSGISITNGAGAITIAATGGGTVTSVTASAPLASSGGATPNISLTGTVAVANGGTGTNTAFTPGSIVFAGTSGIYTQDNANLFFDDSNNRLGIGTATPNERLTVSGALSLAEGTAPSLTSGFGKFYALSTDSRPYFLDDGGQGYNLTLDRFNGLTAGATVTINTAPNLPVFNSVTLNQNTAFATSNLGNGRSASVRVVCDATTRTLTFPGTWTWLGSGPPASLAANDVGYLSITAYGATDADVVAAWSYKNEPAAITGTGAATRVAFWNSTTTLSSNVNLYWDNTNSRLGVNTATPSTAIDLASGQLAIPDGTAAAPAIALRDDLNTGIFSPANDVIGISVNATEVARFQQTGANLEPTLLLGTSTVSANFTVDATTSVAGAALIAHGAGGTAFQEAYRGGQYAGLRTRGTKASPTQIGADDGMLSLFGAGWTATSTINYGALITMKAEQAFTATASGSRIEFHTTLNGTDGSTTLGGATTERMRITNGGLVGVGTATPNERLTVNGSLSLAEGTAPSATANFGKFYALSTDSRPYFLDDGGQAYNLTLDRFNTLTPAASVAIDTNPSLPVFNSLAISQNTTFTTSNLGNGRSASIRISNSTASSYTLTWPGTWTWLGTGAPTSIAANTTGYLSITAYGATDANVVAAWSFSGTPAAVTGLGAATRVAFWSGTSSLASNGNLYWDNTNSRLGVGTTTPASLIQAQGSGDVEWMRVSTTATGGGSCDFYASGTGPLNFQGPSGGVNTSSTGFPFKINVGNTNVATFGSTIAIFNDPASDCDLRVESVGNQNMLFVDAGANRVGIGTGTPAATLQVVGESLINGITVGRGNTSAAATSTAVGVSALAVATGADNTAVGNLAADLVTTGTQNTAVGSSALGAAVTTSNATAVGFNALLLNTAAGNTAVGSRALDANTTGTGNVAVGLDALGTNSTASDSTAVGSRALENATGGGNTAVGTNAAQGTTSGTGHTAVGRFALANATTASSCTAIGSGALQQNNASELTAVGRGALALNSSGLRNVAVGWEAAVQNTTASDITAIGHSALRLVEVGENTAVGSLAADVLVSGTRNVAVGSSALGAASTSNDCTAVGASAGDAITTGVGHVAIGTNALGAQTDSNYCTAVGFEALLNVDKYSNITGVGYRAGVGLQFGTAIGTQALESAFSGTAVGAFAAQYVATTGAGNTAVGQNALRGNNVTQVTGSNNVAIGNDAMLSVRGAAAENVVVGARALDATIGAASRNTAIGFQTLTDATGGTSDNVAVGHNAMGGTAGTPSTCVAVGVGALSFTTASELTAVGYQALQANTTGTGNVGVGYHSLTSNQTGADNVAVGYDALQANTTGSRNVGVGYRSLTSNQGGVDNVAVGHDALLLATSGSNVAIGSFAADALTTGDNNVAIGVGALGNSTTVQAGVFIGSLAGTAITAVTANVLSVAVGFNAEVGTTSLGSNTAIGADAGTTITSGTNVTCIGYNAEPTSGTASNQINLGDGSVTDFRIGTSTLVTPNPGFNVVNISGTAGATRTRLNIGHDGGAPNAGFIDFYINASLSGGIREAGTGGTPLVYATTSDYRVKTDIQPIEAPLERLAALKPKRFHFSTNAAGSPLVEGFIAHEVQEVVPQAVTGSKDEVDADGNPVYQGLDQGHLVPLLTAACQELAAKVAAAEARVAVAEARADAADARADAADARADAADAANDRVVQRVKEVEARAASAEVRLAMLEAAIATLQAS